MDCHKNFICARTTCAGVDTVKPTSGLYIDDLPGLSTQALTGIEPGKYQSAATMLEEKVRVACDKVFDLARAVVEPYLREHVSVEAGEIGQYDDPVTYAAGSAAERGVRVKLDGGILMRMLIPRVWIQAEDDVDDLEVKVYDGSVLTRHKVDLVAGVRLALDLHLLAEARTVEVIVADNRFKPATGDTDSTTYFSTCVTCGGRSTYEHLAGTGMLDGDEVTALQGIAVQVIASCNLEAAVCMLLKRLKWVVLYQLGIECLEEWLATQRFNFLGIHGKKWAQDTLPRWQREVADRIDAEKYSLTNLLKKLTPECMTCGSGVTAGYARP